MLTVVVRKYVVPEIHETIVPSRRNVGTCAKMKNIPLIGCYQHKAMVDILQGTWEDDSLFDHMWMVLNLINNIKIYSARSFNSSRCPYRVGYGLA